jgi:phage terminase large subunit GpA-like protein
MYLTLLDESEQRGSRVRSLLPVIAWAMLRIHNVHSKAFKGRYSPENSPWGVEMVECQYWRHVRTVDSVGPNQIGKTFHVCELPVLFDLVEARETVFYMNGTDDNAKNLWSTRWEKTLLADPVLREQLLPRVEAGRWQERHFLDGGLLYSTGSESVSSLAQRESRIVRCSELEKTRAALGNEASSYALAKDRAGAYPSNYLITSDCTVTVRTGLSWVRFHAGDRSRPFIPCPGCGHYAMPAHERHLAEPDLNVDRDSVHLMMISDIAMANPEAAEETATLCCLQCGFVFSNTDFRRAMRAVVWVPAGCYVTRHDNPKETPLPRVTWLDDLSRWAAEQLADPEVVSGMRDPLPAPEWSGPRLPEGVTLDYDPQKDTREEVRDLLPELRSDPRRSSSRSFWLWRLCGMKYTIGQVAREYVAGELGKLTGDLRDDRKSVSQKCLVIPHVDIGANEESPLNEKTVLLARCQMPRKTVPLGTIAITGGVDINEDRVRGVKRAFTADGEAYLIDHIQISTGLAAQKAEGLRWDPNDPRYVQTQTKAILGALDKMVRWYRGEPVKDENGKEFLAEMIYVDAGGTWAEEVYGWCKQFSTKFLRPSKGYGGNRHNNRRSLVGRWTDTCEQKAAACGLRHQYYELDDARRLMILDVDHWKREVHDALRAGYLYHKAKQLLPNQEFELRPWFFIHADVSDNDDYVSQVVAERWEEWVNLRGMKEVGWKVYSEDNHFLDCDGYSFAAAKALGIAYGQKGAELRKKKRKMNYGVIGEVKV